MLINVMCINKVQVLRQHSNSTSVVVFGNNLRVCFNAKIYRMKNDNYLQKNYFLRIKKLILKTIINVIVSDSLLQLHSAQIK